MLAEIPMVFNKRHFVIVSRFTPKGDVNIFYIPRKWLAA